MSEDFHPHISADKDVREFTFRSVLLGLAFGFLFAIANAYLALKLGTTISASIPAAIMSMAILRLFRKKKATVLENNIVQTIATVGEGLAAGMIFTIPALIMLGNEPSIFKIFLLSATGGILGILLMIPMRRFLIVKEHKRLPFPEGTACASILKAESSTHKSGIMAFWGLILSAGYKICTSALFLWREGASWAVSFYEKAVISIDVTPALLGVGYIIGPVITGTMFAGGLLAWWVLIPVIQVFGLGSTAVYPSTLPIGMMSPDDIWNNYIRYIGAGTLAVGGLLSLVKIFPLLFSAIRVGVTELFHGFLARAHIKRTDRDISMAWLILGSLGVILFLWKCPGMEMNLFTIVLLTVLSFIFVAVTSMTVGLVGSTSNPVSGMTITIVLITCVIFVLLGWRDSMFLVSAITMSSVACTAICLAGTTSQDLKTGFLLGATPQKQQIAELIGIIIPSLALGYTMYLLNETYGIGSKIMPAPQASMIKMIAEGVMNDNLPYPLFGAGALIGVVLAIVRVPVLSFGLGLYLPLSLSAATMVGGLVRAFINRKYPSEAVQERGTLFSSGLIGGDACIGIVIALLTVFKLVPLDSPAILSDWFSLGTFLALGCSIIFFATRTSKNG
jgi:putative OPT family oligopeptide transporter